MSRFTIRDLLWPLDPRRLVALAGISMAATSWVALSALNQVGWHDRRHYEMWQASFYRACIIIGVTAAAVGLGQLWLVPRIMKSRLELGLMVVVAILSLILLWGVAASLTPPVTRD